MNTEYYSAGRKEGPDQGYAWVVALACFFINFLLVGVARSVAVMYVALVEAYGVTRQQATLPFSIRVSLKSLSGPLIGLLGLKYGIRRVTTVGGCVAALGIFLCFFAPNVLWITIFWGIIHGIGFGLSTIIHMMIISQYFDKYKASALGLAYSGDCFGTFAFPVVMEHLISTYDVRGTFLILSGIILNVVPMALLLKKPPWLQKNKKQVNLLKNIPRQNLHRDKFNNKEVRESLGYRNEAFLKFDEDLSPFQCNMDGCYKYNSVIDDERRPTIYQHGDKEKVMNNLTRDVSVSSVNGSIRSHRKSSGMSIQRHDSLVTVYEKEVVIASYDQQYAGQVADDNESLHGEHKAERTSIQQDQTVHYSESTKRRRSSVISQMAHRIVHRMRSASFASQVAQDGFMINLQQGQEEPDIEESQKNSLQQNHSTRNSRQNEHLFDTKNSGKNGGPELILSPNNVQFSIEAKSLTPPKPLNETKHHSILKTLIQTNLKPIFFLISISMAVYAYCFLGVITIIIDYAGDQGVPQDLAKYLIIGFSVTDLIGRLTFGQIIDRKLIKMKNYSGITMLLMGTLVASLPFNSSFNYMIVCMCLYGLVQGGTAIMFPILVNHYMEKNEESIAMGCLNFYAGILMLSMAPMIGHFRDNVGSYNGVFHIFGGLVAVVGLMWQLEPLILKFQVYQKQKQEDWVIVTRL